MNVFRQSFNQNFFNEKQPFELCQKMAYQKTKNMNVIN